MTAITERHFYGRRRNRGLHKQRQAAFDIISQRFFVTPPNGDAVFQPAQFFAPETPRDLWLEIGFGYGEHLTHQAALHPDVGFIGIEPFINGIAVAAMAMVEQNVENIRIYPDDAMHLLPRFAPGSFSHIFLFFPDPWPKTRHHKRRFVQPETVAIFANLLKPGGILHMATDIPDLADWMIEHVTANPAFRWTEQRAADRITPPKDWVTTKYQDKAIREGRSSQYMDFVKQISDKSETYNF
jgi:tRNA (guanine-N7-)-methyltransferase